MASKSMKHENSEMGNGKNNLVHAKRSEIASIAEKIVDAVGKSIASKFSEREILVLFDGSISGSSPYNSVLGVSDIDITLVIPERLGRSNVLNLEKFRVLTSAIKEAIIESEKKDGIFVVTSHNFPEESLIEDLAEYHIRERVGNIKGEINLALLDCVIYPSIDSIESWSNIRTDGLKFATGLITHGKIVYGNSEVRDNLLKELLLAKERRDAMPVQMNEFDKSVINAEKHLADANVFVDSNINLPYKTMAKYMMKRLKVVGNLIGNAMLRESMTAAESNEHYGSWGVLMRNGDRLPSFFKEFIVSVNEMRNKILNTGKLPSMEELKKLHSDATDVVSKAKQERLSQS